MDLVRSHRVFGYVTARAQTAEGEVVILQTAPHKQEVSPAHMVLPVSADEAVFEARMALAAAIERARFLGVDEETLRGLFTDEVQRPVR
jgi:hypothetical protein